MAMTRVQAEALATLVGRLRTDWDHRGIVAAIERAVPTANAWDISHALLHLAEDRAVKTPGMLVQPGKHWRKPDGTATPRRGDHAVRCPEHPLSVMPCPECVAKRVPPPVGFHETVAEALERGKAAHRERMELAARRAAIESSLTVTVTTGGGA